MQFLTASKNVKRYCRSHVPHIRVEIEVFILAGFVMSEIQVEVPDGRHESFEGLVEVTNKEYPVESIWLTKTKSQIRGISHTHYKCRAHSLSLTSSKCERFLRELVCKSSI